MTEIWKNIIGFEDSYQISNIGNVKSKNRRVNSKYGKTRFVKGQILKNIIDKDGYHKVNLKRNQKGKTLFVHRLVCIHFHENPQNKKQVNHINGVKNDNRCENLEWCTASENRKHAYKTGLQNGLTRRGDKNNFSKLTEKKVLVIKKMIKNKIKQKCIASVFKVNPSAISAISSKKNWAWLN